MKTERRNAVIRQIKNGFKRNPLGLIGLIILIVIILLGIFAPFIAPYSPTEFNVGLRMSSPSADHLFGTDVFGRDLFSRVLFGIRISLQASISVLLFSSAIGVIVGAIAGYMGGIFDELVMRVVDIFFAFPPLILAMAINFALGPSIKSAVFAVIITWWPGYARIVRSQVLSAKNRLYVHAARSIGVSKMGILFRHILPNCIRPTTVQITLDTGAIILTLAGLSFIGLGANPPTPELGLLVNEGRRFILSQWWLATYPGLVICFLVIGANLFGDFLRDFLDPKVRSTL